LGLDTIYINLRGLVLSKISGVNLVVDHESLDFEKIAKEFKNDSRDGASVIDYEAFAAEMLARGTKRLR
jgi:hypothetical protein